MPGGKMVLRTRIWMRDGYLCWLCGKDVEWADMTVDHVLPRSKGGTDRQSNLRCAHWLCNNKRGDKAPAPAIQCPQEAKDHG
jgi:5-methylcytosine-specific restriction endonuclease McrA